MNATKENGFFVKLPPPLFFAAAFLAGYFVQRIAIGPLPPAHGAFRIAGIMLAAAAVLMVLSSAVLFIRHRTTVIPHGEPARLITGGPFRITRNPLYVSLAVVYIGIALMTQTWFALLLLPIPVILVDRFFIPMEESKLRRHFGEAYFGYSARVRRWL